MLLSPIIFRLFIWTRLLLECTRWHYYLLFVVIPLNESKILNITVCFFPVIIFSWTLLNKVHELRVFYNTDPSTSRVTYVKVTKLPNLWTTDYTKFGYGPYMRQASTGWSGIWLSTKSETFILWNSFAKPGTNSRAKCWKSLFPLVSVQGNIRSWEDGPAYKESGTSQCRHSHGDCNASRESGYCIIFRNIYPTFRMKTLFW